MISPGFFVKLREVVPALKDGAIKEENVWGEAE